MKPKEGTILTVARVIAEDAIEQAEAHPDDYDGLMTVILRTGEAILKQTRICCLLCNRLAWLMQADGDCCTCIPATRPYYGARTLTKALLL